MGNDAGEPSALLWTVSGVVGEVIDCLRGHEGGNLFRFHGGIQWGQIKAKARDRDRSFLSI